MSVADKELRHFAAIDEAIVAATRNIKLLGLLSWSVEVQQRFLQDWAAGKPRLPDVSYPRHPGNPAVENLERLCAGLDQSHPIGHYLARTAQCYVLVYRMLEHLGTPAVTDLSIQLYGRPGDSLAGGRVHNIEAAQHFIEVADEYSREYSLHDDDYALSAEVMRQALAAAINPFFNRHRVEVEVDPALASKAAAGASRIRIRSATLFSKYDLDQLLQHEAFVHCLTALNGREQRHLKSMGLGAPRTTATQEGLATFAELVTGAIDIARMKRIALRVIGIDMALKGADFIEVFRFFLDAGQSEVESFNSAMRIFRGVPLTGGSAFTKDTVYIHGLMSVHTFFRWCLQHQKLKLCRYLFAGRMTINDVIRLEPWFESGAIDPPLYVPPWMMRTNGLAGYLAFSVFANKIPIKELHEGYAFDDLREMGI